MLRWGVVQTLLHCTVGEVGKALENRPCKLQVEGTRRYLQGGVTWRALMFSCWHSARCVPMAAMRL